ncbi:unnamed protein product [Urochloa decumbens]|uniref:Uncharacterized protein n=1 Tax=Urochloa decumbens TaxID=240449 RepID=A0ABC8Y0B0_9POAL
MALFTGVSFVGSSTPPPATQSALAFSGAASKEDSGYHLLVVHEHSVTKKNTPNGRCIRSRRFRVGGYRWRIEYYPNGSLSEDPGSMSFYLYLDEDHVVKPVEVNYKFIFVDPVHEGFLANRPRYFSSHACWGCLCVLNDEEDLYRFEHLENDSFTVRCDLMVIGHVENGAAAMRPLPFVELPPPDIQRHLNGLLLSGEGADVTFEVNGETFAAHRCLLAARSSVFKVELFGPMVEGTTGNVIRIDDIEAQVFKLLLSFIYSDSVPEIEKEDEEVVIWQHLLVAADKYDLQRLRLMCEVKLYRHINATTVAIILVLAEQHYCRGLKEACLDFLASSTNVQEVMAAGVLDNVISNCPSVLKELIAKLALLKFDVNIVDNGAAPMLILTVPEPDLHQHFSWLLQSEEGTDVTFQVGGEMVSAHRCVLAARSAVFRDKLYGPMKEDSATGVICIDDMEAKVFRLLLTFIYIDSVPNMMGEQKEHDEADVTWQHLLMAADRYGLQRLRMICEVNLCRYINTTTVATILVLAEQHHCGCLKEACLDFLDVHANLQEVMMTGGLDHLRSSCPSVLIDVITKLASLKRDN